MKFFLTGLFAIAIFLFPKEETPVYPPVQFCHPTTEFASFADDSQFIEAHYEQATVDFMVEKGNDIKFAVEDGEKANAFLIQPDEPSDKWIFVIHEWWGLNDHIKKEAEKYFNELENYNVMALDLYDGKVAGDRETAAKYMQGVKVPRLELIIRGAYEFAGENAKVGTVGWCFGGGWSLQSGILGGEQAKASVIFYGMPEKDPAKLKNLSADVLGIFASQEQWITPEVVQQFEKNMKLLNKPLTVKNYDAQHAFANPSRPAYVKEYADEAFDLTINFFKERI
ncbi:MAG: dienelactone hydrolase family protein [Flavobacteriales bacterium]|nr:dienelactone hydrolase family protein [Flavobacteriales bacterium]